MAASLYMLCGCNRYPSGVTCSLLNKMHKFNLFKGSILTAAVLVLSLAATVPVHAKRSAHHSTSSHHAAHGKSRGRAASTIHVSRHSGKHSTIPISHKHGRQSRHVAVSNHLVHHAAPVSYPEPHAENVQNANSLASVYRLYDRGVNERLMGLNEQATKTLREASNAYSSAQRGLTLEAMIDYELGQAAEASNNYSVAADAYARTLRIKPNLIEASVRLTSMLMKAGQPQAALRKARDSVAMNPNDPRAHQILALVLDGNGLDADAKIERESAERLLRSRSSVNYADVPQVQNQEPVSRLPGIDGTGGANSPAESPAGTGSAPDLNNTDNVNGTGNGIGTSTGTAGEAEMRRARQEEQWRIYQQQHGQGQPSTSRATTEPRAAVDRRPFQTAPTSGGEFYRARVEPANKPSSTTLEKRESTDFPKGSSDAVKTYTPDPPKNSAANPSKTSSPESAKGSSTDANGTKPQPPVEPVDNDVMP